MMSNKFFIGSLLIVGLLVISFSATVQGYEMSTLDIVDSNSTDVDSSADKGTESNFAYCQDQSPDSDYMTIQESNYGESAVNENKAVDGFTSTWVAWTENGVSPYLSASDGTNNIFITAGDLSDEGWFTLADTTATGSFISSTLYIEFDSSGGEVCNWYIDTTGDNTQEFSGTIANGGSAGVKNSGVISGLDTATEVNNARVWLEYDYTGGSDDMQIDYVYLNIYRAGGSNYMIDFEYQFTSCITNRMVSELCFYTYAITGSETLNVNYRNGGSWSSLTTITTTGWKNVTITATSTYTIQLIGATETGDSEQGQWNIDVILIHTYDKITVVNNTVDVTGKYEVRGNSVDGWTIYLNFTGISCDSTDLTVHNNTAHTTGKYETSYNALTGWDIWLNYTGAIPTLTKYENIVDATGTHESSWDATNWLYKVWANYTGTGGSCSGIVWVNYTDTNLTFNVSVDKATNSNTSTYALNEDNVISIAGFSLDEDSLGLFLIFALFSIALIVKEENLVWKPILLFLDVPISLATGIYYLGQGAWFSVNWWVGICLFLFAILLSMGGLYYGLSFGRNRK